MFQSAEYVSEHGQIDYVVDPAKEVGREGGRGEGRGDDRSSKHPLINCLVGPPRK